MISKNERYVISYNGEVYNHLALKHYLEKNYNDIVWRTTDTRILKVGVRGNLHS